MSLMNRLEISWQELVEQVDHAHWSDWYKEEPALAGYPSLASLAKVRGPEGDRAFGALLRLASTNGANDRLAALAAMHRLGTCLQRMAMSMGDECPDIDALLLGSAWIEIRSYPLDRPRRGHATHILRATRLAVLRHLKPSRDRYGTEWERIIDPDQLREFIDAPGPTGHESDAEQELSRILLWALRSDVLDPNQVQLLLDVVDTGHTILERPATLKGASSSATVTAIADRQGVSGKTIIRARDQAIAALREALPSYLVEVA